jgi:hypothetical protein
MDDPTPQWGRQGIMARHRAPAAPARAGGY